MSRRTTEASKAVRLAWQKEQELVIEGKGTRDWTLEQQKDIAEKGKAYDDDGRAFEGHHMKSAEKYPEFQGEPDIIQFLTREEHLAAHEGSFQNTTNGYYNPTTGETKGFGLNEYEPCEIIQLSKPMLITIKNVENRIEDTNKNKRNTEESATVNADEIEVTSSISSNAKTKSFDAPRSTKLKQPVSSENVGIFKRFIDWVGMAGKFIVEHKKEIAIVTMTTVGTAIVEAKSGDNDTGEGNASNNTDYISSKDTDSENIYYEESTLATDEYLENDTFSDESVKTSERSSPREHMVKPHGQHYGKDKVWKEKAAYSRGGNNKNSE